MIGLQAQQLLRDIDIGTRMVVRYRFESGATDALGVLVSRTMDTCVIETRRGAQEILLDLVIAAKPVPPAPEPRRRAL